MYTFKLSFFKDKFLHFMFCPELRNDDPFRPVPVQSLFGSSFASLETGVVCGSVMCCPVYNFVYFPQVEGNYY